MKKILANLSVRQRITTAVVLLAAAGGVYMLVQHQREADFRPLFTGVAPEDAAAIVQKLKETGVEYRVPEEGGMVMVPSARLAELRINMAAAGLPKTGRIGFELFDKTNLGATEFTEHINYRRALEGELERWRSRRWSRRASTSPSPRIPCFSMRSSRPRPASW